VREFIRSQQIVEVDQAHTGRVVVAAVGSDWKKW